MSASVKVLIWTYIPTHHQTAFLQALRDRGIDLAVHYFERVPPERVRLGWEEFPELPAGERLVAPHLASLDRCPDWKERIHVIPGYGSGFLIRLAWRLSSLGIRWIHWSEPSRPWLKWYLTYPVKRAYAALINRHSLGALAIGKLARDDFRRWGVKGPLIQFLPYSVAALVDPRQEPSDPSPARMPRFVFIGSLCRRKGIDVLLKAFSSLLRSHPLATLKLVGHDESRGAYLRMAERLGIAHAAEFTGSVAARQVRTILAGCDVLVLPSRFDGWGMVVNEAASLGKALIATDRCGSAHHLIVPGVNGFRIAHTDDQALLGCMQLYCREPHLARLHGERSRTIFAEFTPARNAQRFLDCLSIIGATTEVKFG
jgi:glycosyltransferase involved in cell wall biosynthesis